MTYQNEDLLESLLKNANFSTFAVDILQQYCLHKWDISKMTENAGRSSTGSKSTSIYKTPFEKVGQLQLFIQVHTNVFRDLYRLESNWNTCSPEASICRSLSKEKVSIMVVS